MACLPVRRAIPRANLARGLSTEQANEPCFISLVAWLAMLTLHVTWYLEL